MPLERAVKTTPDAADSGRELRRCLGEFATGVTIMTAQVGDRTVGVTANSFTSLSMDPPLVLWSISRSSRSFAAFTEASHFAVNILSADQIALSQQFSSGAEDKFEGVSWSRGRTGAPVIEGVVAHLECRRETLFDGGDHTIIVGRVHHFERKSGDVLLFVQGRYGVAVDHPDIKPRTSAPTLKGGRSLRRPS